MANTEITRRWWEGQREKFTLYISQIVLEEARQGDTEIANKRLEALQGLGVLEITRAAQDLGRQFIAKSSLPTKASDDAIHIAVATVHKLDYLLTWNCKHIANGQIQKKLAEICDDFGCKLPIICTPYELMGG